MQTRSDAAPAARAEQLLAPNPANRALESLTPTFRWQAAPDAVRYRAQLKRADTDEPVALVVEGTQARLAPNTTLQAGMRYRLTIEALATGEVAGEGLTAVYEFRTLTPDEQTRLRWARANRQNAPRTCVAMFYQLGCYADARETLSMLPADDPLVQRWRTVLEAHLR